MAISKVIYGEDTLIDLTADTVTPETLAAGTTAHNSAGEAVIGTVTMLTVEEITQQAAQKVDKESLGLNNVDNTSDMDKPVSTAQQAALAGKAPAGYGLGEHSKYTADCHTITENGWYYTDTATLNMPPYNFAYAAIIAKTRADNLVLEMTEVVSGAKAQCYKNGDVWSAWEYENPPMVPGVEYRTTERWNGKAVYTQMRNGLSLPNTHYRDIEFYIPNDSKVLRYRHIAHGPDTSELPMVSGTTVQAYGYFAASESGLLYRYKTNSDLSNYTESYVQVWYTKE